MSKSRVGLLAFALLAVALLASLVVGCGDASTTDDSVTTTKYVQAAGEIQAIDLNVDSLAILGLGAGPLYYPDRNNTGFALVHNEKVYMIDCGMGTPHLLQNLGVTFNTLEGLFFTHYHIDHTAGYADLLSRGSQANQPEHHLWKLEAYGPSLPEADGVNGLDVLTDGLLQAFSVGYEFHWWAKPYVPAPAGTPAPRPNVTTHPFAANSPDAIAPITVLDDPNMLVEAIEVDHDEDFGTCYAYRFTLRDEGAPTGKVVVFSGDRADYNARRDPNPETSAYYAEGGYGYEKEAFYPEHPTNEEFRDAFISFADGATILVHEATMNDWVTVITTPDNTNPVMRALYWHLIDSHTDVSLVPQIAKDANAGTLVLNHYGDYAIPNLPLAEGAAVILSAIEEANADVGYEGKIIAPLEGDVIEF